MKETQSNTLGNNSSTGSKTHCGYSIFSPKGRRKKAHRNGSQRKTVWSVPSPSLELGTAQILAAFFAYGLGRVSGSDYVDDEYKQTRSWIGIDSVYLLKRHGASI